MDFRWCRLAKKNDRRQTGTGAQALPSPTSPPDMEMEKNCSITGMVSIRLRVSWVLQALLPSNIRAAMRARCVHTEYATVCSTCVKVKKAHCGLFVLVRVRSKPATMFALRIFVFALEKHALKVFGTSVFRLKKFQATRFE